MTNHGTGRWILGEFPEVKDGWAEYDKQFAYEEGECSSTI